MLNQAFEIKVALLGHVSVGKTTLLNALLGDKFGEVSRKRTTAGVNFFHLLSSRSSEKKSAHSTASSAAKKPEEGCTQRSKDVLKEITRDNEILRKSNTLQERHFDVSLDQPLIEMRDDTSLTLVDIPGINEAHTKQMYLDYVKKVWADLDCVVVVMDATLGVNGESEIELLRFVKANITELKDIPVVVLCNKVDDPDDVEIQGMVEEVRREVARIFQGESGSAAGSAGNTPGAKRPAGGFGSGAFSIGTTSASAPVKPNPFGGAAPAPFGSTGSGSSAARPATSSFSFGAPARAPPPFGSAPAVAFPAPASVASPSPFGSAAPAPAAPAPSPFGSAPAVSVPAPASVASPSPFGSAAPAPAFAASPTPFGGGSASNTPTFLPISAENAFLYRFATQLLLDDAIEPDHAYLEKIGHEEVGKYKWKKLSDSEKREIVCGVVSDPVQYKERLHASNFDSFINALKSCLSGKDNQTRIIEKQLEVELKSLSISNGITSSLSKIYDRCVALGKQTDHLKEKFWSLIDASTAQAFAELGKGPTKVDGLHVPMNELVMYANGLHVKLHRSSGDQAKKSDEEKIVEAMTALIKQQVCVILENEMSWTPRNLRNQSGVDPSLTKWSDMAPRDWSTIVSSVLLLSRNEHFYTRFGQEVADLEWLGRMGQFSNLQIAQQYRQYEKGQYVNGEFVPNNPHLYARAVHLKVPATIEDKNHWGHLAWLFCKFMDSRV